MFFVGLGHKMEVGKDTFANILVGILEARGHRAINVSFGDYIYKTCQLLYGWDGFKSKEYYDANKAQKDVPLPTIGITPRNLLIDTGAKMREIYPRTWIDLCIHEYTDYDVVINSSVRYPNEVEALRERNVLLLKINNPRAPKSNDVADNALNPYLGWDGTIMNDAGLDHLTTCAEGTADWIEQIM